MTEDQIRLVNESFETVKPIADTAAHLFYGHLFEHHPHLQLLFRGDMAEQGRKLMATLGVAVASACDMPALRGPLEALASRHVGYGARPEHFDAVGEALIWTLAQGLGHRFTPAVRDAWLALYADLVGIMRPVLAEGLIAQSTGEVA